MATPVTNFGKVTVPTDYDASATSIALTTGHGSRLPSTFPYPLTWWNFTSYPDPADDPNREIVTVTNRVGDTLTVTRGAESSGASTKNTASKMLLGVTKAMWDALSTGRALSQTFRNLRVASSYSAGSASAIVEFSADAIVMNDGEEVSFLGKFDINLAASGVNGLDTGTEQASTWYELYAIYNGSTKAGCFHRAKDFFLDEDITAGEDASQNIRGAVDNSTVKVSQGFQVDVAGPVPCIDVKLLKTGTPTGLIWFTMEANNGGVPSNTPLATSVTIDVARLTTVATQVRIPFPTPVSISAATQYHIVAQGDWTVSATNYVNWRMDGTAATYANGSKALFDLDTSTWTADTDDDLWLRVYVEQNNVAFSSTVPAGYRYALIGYAYNDASSNLAGFLQRGTEWRYANLNLNGLVVNETASTVSLIDLRSVVPPLNILTVVFGITGTGAAAGGVSIGDIRATDIAATSNTGRQLCIYSVSGIEEAFNFGSCNCTYSAVMADGTAGADLYVAGFTW